jgi:diguanylate cyclase (GGDEF)-like protein
MGSFKLKLVGYFLLLSLLPLAAAFWGFSTVTSRSETRRVDARLQAGLRAALVAYQERLNAAQRSAVTLARDPTFQDELRRLDRPDLTRMLRDAPDLYIRTPYGFSVGHAQAVAASREVDVLNRNGKLGTIVAYVPFDGRLAAALHARSGLARTDTLVLVDDRQVVAADPANVFGSVSTPSGATGTATIGGRRYRAAIAASLGDGHGASLAALTPQSVIDAANATSQKHLLVGLLAALLLVAGVAYFEGRSIVRTLRNLVGAADSIAQGRLDERVPVRGRDEFAVLGRAFNEMADQLEARLDELEAERARLRDAIARFGEALGATHDPDQLLRVIVETALGATNASFACLDSGRGPDVVAGDPDANGERLALPLQAGQTSFGTLVLVGDEFDEDARMTAASLVAQAVIALDNARLHRIVEQQALVDGLTGLGNRRQSEEALSHELSRAGRFGSPLALVFADLDDFKAVNDEHGHPVGDAVLREFAGVLKETVRESDHAGRWGGEEFVLLLPGTDAEGGAQLAERVRTALHERTIIAPDGTPIRMTASFGVAAHPPAADQDELVAAADTALYRAKREGKDRVEVAPGAAARARVAFSQ